MSTHSRLGTTHEEETEAWPYQCLVAQTALVVPFHWGDAGRVPGEKGHLARYLLMDKLLQRFVVHPDTGERLFLWETNRTIPFEIGELSAYLKHILGWDDTVKYFKENRSAKERAFGLRGGNGAPTSPRRAAHAKRNAGGDEELVEEVVYGEDTKNFADMELWKCQRLVMSDHVRRIVFPYTCLWVHPNADDVHIESSSNTLSGDPHAAHDASEAPTGGKEDKAPEDLQSCRVDITKVELILYPLGNGLLVFHVDWKPDPTSPLALAQLRSWLFMAKFKHKVRGIFYGWTLGRPEEREGSGHYFGAHCDSLGKLSHSIYGGAFMSLSNIGNWLVHLPSEETLRPPHRISYSAYANHHTVVVIDRQPSKKHLREYLRHLTRAFNVNSMMPEVQLSEATRHHSALEKILPHRRNRYLGLSAEGNVSFSWLTEDANPQFELVTWPKVYQGIYLILDLHTRGEASVLSELSGMSAKVAEHMHLCTLDRLEKDRLKLRSVAMQMIKYSLGLSSDVCSGMSEYAQFFTTARKVLGIPEGKQKVREEIEHVLNIVESVYMEEQRRKGQQEKKEIKKKELAQRRIESQKEARHQRFETLVSIVGTVTLPLMLVSGIMGMNLRDLPRHIGFWPILGYSALASLVFFCLLLLWYRYSQVHHFIFRRYWARERAMMDENEEEKEDIEDKIDEQYPLGGSTLRRGTSDDHRGPQDEAYTETTPLFHRR